MNVLGSTFSGVTISGAAMNIAIHCRVCGELFDAAPSGGAAVRIDTMPDGRLSVRQVVHAVTDARRRLADLGPDELAAVRIALDEVAAGRADPEDLAAASGALKAWIEANPVVAASIITTLGPVLAAVVTALLNMWMAQGRAPAEPVPEPPANVVIVDHFPTDDEIENWVKEELERREGPADGEH